MSSDISTIRERIQAQGFCGLDDNTYAKINYPLRLAPAFCMVLAAIGTAMESSTFLWVLVPLAALGMVMPGSPFDVLYNHGLRHLTGGPRLPVYTPRRRFACGMATVMLIATALAFQSGQILLGQIVGWSLVGAAFVNVSTGFCVPSFIVRLMFGKVVCPSS